MRFRWLRPTDAVTLGLYREAGANAERAILLLRDLLADYPEQIEIADELIRLEHDGDRLTHDIIHRLNGGGAGKVPFDPFDGHALATAIDDVVDLAEETADRLGVYRVEAPMEQAGAIADVLVGAGEQVARALAALADGRDVGPHLVEIHRLENEADRLTRDAVASLFVNGIDPMVVIRWKDVFEVLEATADACEDVAHVLEGIVLKQHHRRGR
jgi:uncharacterized protein Yka (UPF0111/DUF47 family)